MSASQDSCKYQLKGLQGQYEGKTRKLEADVVWIGRVAENSDPDSPHLLFHDQSVSRAHAVLVWAADYESYVVHHRSQTNPTFLNEQPLNEPTLLKTGDTIGIGLQVLRFEKLSQSVEIQLATTPLSTEEPSQLKIQLSPPQTDSPQSFEQEASPPPPRIELPRFQTEEIPAPDLSEQPKLGLSSEPMIPPNEYLRSLMDAEPPSPTNDPPEISTEKRVLPIGLDHDSSEETIQDAPSLRVVPFSANIEPVKMPESLEPERPQEDSKPEPEPEDEIPASLTPTSDPESISSVSEEVVDSSPQEVLRTEPKTIAADPYAATPERGVADAVAPSAAESSEPKELESDSAPVHDESSSYADAEVPEQVTHFFPAVEDEPVPPSLQSEDGNTLTFVSPDGSSHSAEIGDSLRLCFAPEIAAPQLGQDDEFKLPAKVKAEFLLERHPDSGLFLVRATTGSHASSKRLTNLDALRLEMPLKSGKEIVLAKGDMLCHQGYCLKLGLAEPVPPDEDLEIHGCLRFQNGDWNGATICFMGPAEVEIGTNCFFGPHPLPVQNGPKCLLTQKGQAAIGVSEAPDGQYLSLNGELLFAGQEAQLVSGSGLFLGSLILHWTIPALHAKLSKYVLAFEGMNFPINKSIVRIGTAPHCEILISGAGLSEVTGVLELTDDGFIYRHLDPSIPALVEGEQVAEGHRCKVEQGHSLQLGLGNMLQLVSRA